MKPITLPQFSSTPDPPYIAVIFTSLRSNVGEGYAQTAGAMVELASAQEGYLGVESCRDAEGLGITVSYWRSRADVVKWKAHADHIAAQRAGKEKWYRAYITRVAVVERQYGFERDGGEL